MSYGVGKHVKDVPEGEPLDGNHVSMAGRASYIVISSLTKWIVGLFLLRICPNARWRKVTIWTIMGAVTIFNTVSVFLAIFSCQPVEYEWMRYSPNPPPGECRTTSFALITSYVSAFLNVVGDWVVPILPATLVWKAQMNRKMKISVVALLALGSM